MSKKVADILAFTPHPFNIEMGMGGTIAHFTQEGKNINKGEPNGCSY